MNRPTNIEKTINAISGNPKLDRAVKEVLADPQVVARILKRVTQEFKNESIDDIMDAIEGKPTISEVIVEPGLTNSTDNNLESYKINGQSTESNISNEGLYYFDIMFSAKVPNNKMLDFGIRIIVDIEGQYDYHKKYDIVTRGLFYASRMISSQSGREFIGEDFDKLRKVYSIWICMDPPKYASNSIVRFGVEPTVMYGNFPQDKINSMKYNLLDVILICLSTEDNPDKDELCGMLEVLLNENTSKEDRLKKLESDYGMKRTVDLEKELDGMCDYSVGIARKNYLKGIDEGISQGINQGKEDGQNDLIKAISMLRDGKSRDEIIKSGIDVHTIDLAQAVK